MMMNVGYDGEDPQHCNDFLININIINGECINLKFK